METLTREEKIAAIRKAQQAERQSKIDAIRESREEPWYEDLAEGVAVAGMDTYYGIKDLAGKMDDEDRATLEDWKQDAAQSGWGTTGRVLGEVAQLAVPGSVGVKAARGLSAANKAIKTARALPLATDVAAAAAHGAVRLPQENESRGWNALSSAGAAGAGAMVAKPLQALIGKPMFRRTAQAKKLMDEGVNLTPGMAAESELIKSAEAVMEVTPFLARGTKALREEAKEDWAGQVLKKAVPANMSDGVTKIGQKGVKQASKLFKAGYAKAWGGADSLAPRTLPRVHLAASKGSRDMSKKDNRVVERVTDQISDLLKRNPDVNALKIDQIIREALPTKPSKIDLRDTLTAMRDTLRAGLPDESLKSLGQLDKAWPKFLTVRKASRKASEKDGVFTPKQLLSSSSTVGKDALAGIGKAPLQKAGQAGMATVGRDVGGQPLEWFRRVAAGTPTLLPLNTMGRISMGQTKPQSYLADLLRTPQMVQKIEPYITPARYGAAYEE